MTYLISSWEQRFIVCMAGRRSRWAQPNRNIAQLTNVPNNKGRVENDCLKHSGKQNTKTIHLRADHGDVRKVMK